MKRVIAAAIVWPPAFFLTGLMFFKTGPDLEQMLSPVLDDQIVTNVSRIDDTVCWKWRFIKQHDAEPQGSAWSFVILGTSVDYPAVVQRQNDGRIIERPRNRTPGPGTTDFCSSIPGYLTRVPNLEIQGSIAYRPAHGWWLVWQELPAVKVPPPPAEQGGE